MRNIPQALDARESDSSLHTALIYQFIRASRTQLHALSRFLDRKDYSLLGGDRGKLPPPVFFPGAVRMLTTSPNNFMVGLFQVRGYVFLAQMRR
jgi:hypothetical protein